MAFADRFEHAADDFAALAGEMLVVERGLELLFEVILAAFDLVDDRLVIVAGDRRLEVEPCLVKAAEGRTRRGFARPRACGWR